MVGDFLEELGAAVEAHGLAAVEDDVDVVVAASRAHRLSGVALDVLADRAAPEVARCRALARIAPLLLARSERGAPPAADRAGRVLDGVA